MKILTKSLLLATIAIFSGCSDDDDTQIKPQPKTNNPAVEASSPVNNAADVALDKEISVAFNQTMNATTINKNSFILAQGETKIGGTVSFADFTATFKPDAALSENTTYTATITTEAKNESAVGLSSDFEWSFSTGTNATGMKKVNLGSSANFTILAKTAINNSPTSAVTGDIGISPAAATFITGFSLVDATGYANSAQISGKAFAADMAAPTPTILTVAINDMVTAYNEAAGRSNPDFNEMASGSIGGQTMVPGLYKWSNTVNASTDLVISGSATDVWIFQIAGDLKLSSGVEIILSGGARAENIFWQVAGEVTLGTTSTFNGVVLSMTGITMQTNAAFTGRALAQTAVILDANTVTQP